MFSRRSSLPAAPRPAAKKRTTKENDAASNNNNKDNDTERKRPKPVAVASAAAASSSHPRRSNASHPPTPQTPSSSHPNHRNVSHPQTPQTPQTPLSARSNRSTQSHSTHHSTRNGLAAATTTTSGLVAPSTPPRSHSKRGIPHTPHSHHHIAGVCRPSPQSKRHLHCCHPATAHSHCPAINPHSAKLAQKIIQRKNNSTTANNSAKKRLFCSDNNPPNGSDAKLPSVLWAHKQALNSQYETVKQQLALPLEADPADMNCREAQQRTCAQLELQISFIEEAEKVLSSSGGLSELQLVALNAKLGTAFSFTAATASCSSSPAVSSAKCSLFSSRSPSALTLSSSASSSSASSSSSSSSTTPSACYGLCPSLSCHQLTDDSAPSRAATQWLEKESTCTHASPPFSSVASHTDSPPSPLPLSYASASYVTSPSCPDRGSSLPQLCPTPVIMTLMSALDTQQLTPVVERGEAENASPPPPPPPPPASSGVHAIATVLTRTAQSLAPLSHAVVVETAFERHEQQQQQQPELAATVEATRLHVCQSGCSDQPMPIFTESAASSCAAPPQQLMHARIPSGETRVTLLDATSSSAAENKAVSRVELGITRGCDATEIHVGTRGTPVPSSTLITTLGLGGESSQEQTTCTPKGRTKTKNHEKIRSSGRPSPSSFASASSSSSLPVLVSSIAARQVPQFAVIEYNEAPASASKPHKHRATAYTTPSSLMASSSMTMTASQAFFSPSPFAASSSVVCVHDEGGAAGASMISSSVDVGGDAQNASTPIMAQPPIKSLIRELSCTLFTSPTAVELRERESRVLSAAEVTFEAPVELRAITVATSSSSSSSSSSVVDSETDASSHEEEEERVAPCGERVLARVPTLCASESNLGHQEEEEEDIVVTPLRKCPSSEEEVGDDEDEDEDDTGNCGGGAVVPLSSSRLPPSRSSASPPTPLAPATSLLQQMQPPTPVRAKMQHHSGSESWEHSGSESWRFSPPASVSVRPPSDSSPSLLLVPASSSSGSPFRRPAVVVAAVLLCCALLVTVLVALGSQTEEYCDCQTPYT